ncbi:signal recognition particle protein Srp54 [Hyperthermus butylicus]|uniref:Signal recognition particle 54 kDa protein n=1 Tax=Hyperthermus butylicus (strain DSM 5456 / JCM 9403 / PLM1-5) TaxID=415426 RepID=SRP54_HYPBU|nr:signal recognition particle protein Srp54 [Hyperthermus butylicus]A2BNB5.1 RecName: Full=Signal recognition particle 54 kDa protein; Short=SRP54 [Hyperthermus butylicus DSM 5456]ABM81476.1 Signal recognition particle GTPase [Hyperthermus butylicus DSM 5456]
MPGLDDIRRAVSKLLKRSGPYENIVNEFIRDLQRALISADVNVRLVFNLTKRIRERALKEQPPPGLSRREWLVKLTYDELVKLFGGEYEPEVKPPYTPYVIMMVGVQGSGKTTTVGKLAKFYRGMGYRVGVVAADTYRPGAYEQLKQLADRAGAMFYGEPGSKDPVGIARRGVEELKQRGADIVIVDTAGRHGYGEEEALLDEMKRIAEAIKPDEVVLVIDAAMGQKSYDLAKRFHEATPVGSIIVTKMDGTAKGGGALSAVAATGARIKFIGTGEDIDEIEVFRPKRFVARLLGMGDLESLLEKIERLRGVEEFEKTVAEMMSGKITFRTIYKQLQQVTKLGPFRKILQMIPGISTMLESLDEAARLSEEKVKKWLTIMNSMTYEELDNPNLLEERSRVKRIAVGAGVEPSEVRELYNYYKSVKKMMRQLKKRKDLLERFARLGGV